ncbi:MAG: hypothetical protein GXP63_07020 [DPANN group archaeon]|nr:hypothetical protein [DPANN group archaeon]
MDMPPPAPVSSSTPGPQPDADLAMPSFPEPHDADISLPPITDDGLSGNGTSGFPGYIPPPPGDMPAMPDHPFPGPMMPAGPSPEPATDASAVPDAPPTVPEQAPAEPLPASSETLSEPDEPPEATDEIPSPSSDEPDGPAVTGPEADPHSEHVLLRHRDVTRTDPLYIDVVDYTAALEKIKEAGQDFKQLDDGLNRIEKVNNDQYQSTESLRMLLEASARKIQRVDKQILQKRW